MSPTWARPLAWGISSLAALALAIVLTLAVRNGSFGQDGGFIVTAIVFIVAYEATGALIATRYPGNPIGWLFLLVGLGFVVGGMADEWGIYTTITNPGSLPFVAAAAWLSTWSSFLATLIPLIFLLFPDGHAPSRRWRPLVWLLSFGVALGIVTAMFSPGTVNFTSGAVTVSVTKPLTLATFGGPLGTVLGVASATVLLVGGLFAIASLVLRYRRSAGDVRQQIRWVAAAAGLAGVALIGVIATGISSGGNSSANNVAFGALLVTAGIGVPVATAIAILRYRLYDLELVVKKTVVFAVVAAAITAIYVILLFLVPTTIPGLGTGSKLDPLTFVTAIVIAVAFGPVRRQARRLADRIVYGGRATPYEVLSEFSERLGETYSTEDVLPRMAQLLGASTGAEAVRIWLRVGARLEPAAAWPDDGAPADPLPVGEAETALENVAMVPVTHQGAELGAITLRMSPRDPMDPAKEQLVRDVASQAGLVLRNVGLIEELRRSRRRIVSAQDARAKKLERDIHDGAQQQLVALSVKLRLAAQLAERDPAAIRDMLTALQTEATDALENLRDLARGIYPPLLADQGLAAALEAQARKAAMPVRVDADGIGRYPADVETTVYFCTLEALQNVAKYAEAKEAVVTLRPEDRALAFTVADDGRGFDTDITPMGTGIHGMRDRVEALGGTLSIESATGAGTTVIGRVPVA